MKTADKITARLGANISESIYRPPVGDAPAADAPDRHEGLGRPRGVHLVPLDRLVADPAQPRKEFDRAGLEDLAASMKARGQLQPVRVRWDAAAAVWVVVVGERRFRAAALAGMTHLLAVEVPDGQADGARLGDQLVENCLRSDLKPVEEAHAFQALMNAEQISARQLAALLNLSHSRVLRSLALLRLPDDLKEAVDAELLPPTTASAIATNPDPVAKGEAVAAVREAVQRGAVFRPDRRVARFQVEGGNVVVTLGGSASGRERVVQALRAALRSAEAA